MIGNNIENYPLMNKYCYRNTMKQKYQKNMHYQKKNTFINMNQMNMQYNPYQSYHNNYYNNYQNSLFNRNNNQILYNNMNKFNSFYPKKYFNKFVTSKNVFYEEAKDNQENYIETEKTFFKENKFNKKNKKKYSMDSTSTNQISNESSTDDEKEEKEVTEEQNLKIDNYLEDKKNDVSEVNNSKRRFSNFSNSSDCSKASKSTLDTSIASIKEKDVSEEKITDLKENDTKILVDEKHQTNPAFENTEILNVQVKISKDKTAIFKLKRFDDLFLTIKLFCEINSVDEKLIKPLIIKSLSTLNTIYQVMNSKLEEKQIDVLKKIKDL